MAQREVGYSEQNGAEPPVRVIIVGPCVAGKTTLMEKLRALGYDAHSAAQEHAGVRTLWRRKNPDVLIYLDCSFEAAERRRRIAWGRERYEVQAKRLRDARRHANLYLHTDRFTPDQVAGAACRVLEAYRRKRRQEKTRRN